MLQATEWPKTIKTIYAAGELLTGSLAELKEPPKLPNKEWVDSAWGALVLKESQREACKEAIKWAIEKAVVAAGSPLNCLLEKFGLMDE